MTGSVALDVVIGLVFVYLLYSLLATVICEIIATNLGLRARNLHLAVRRMLEDSAVTSEWKLIAFFKSFGETFNNFFANPNGPAGCAFFNLPAIKYLAKNSLFSKPSYITRQTFSKAMMELFRRYGDPDKTDLENIQKVLEGDVNYSKGINEIKSIIRSKLKVQPPLKKIKYNAIRRQIKQLVDAAPNRKLTLVEQKVLGKIKEVVNSKKEDKAALYEIDELLHLFGHETRSHLTSLLKEANNDLLKFRLLLEQWFDDTMERATGWYKYNVQLLLLIIGFFLAVFFNANTIDIAKKLAVDKDARDKIVDLATTYVANPSNRPGTNDSTPSIADSLLQARLDSLEKVRVKLQKDVDEANTILGMGSNLPDSLTLVDIVKQDSLGKLKTPFIRLKYEFQYPKDSLTGEKILLIPPLLFESEITEMLSDDDEDGHFEGVNKKTTKINVNLSWRIIVGRFIYTTYDGFWGFLLTAIAISLGAPFWFDLLNKLMQLRGAVSQKSAQDADVRKENPKLIKG